MSSCTWQAPCRNKKLHEKRKTLAQLTDRLPFLARGALYVLAILAIAVFGIWGPGYSAQAFIYFQF